MIKFNSLLAVLFLFISSNILAATTWDCPDISWPAVTTDTQGNALTPTRYDVGVRDAVTGAVGTYPTIVDAGATPSLSLSLLPLDGNFMVSVAAVNVVPEGSAIGSWGPEMAITMVAGKAVVPGIPSPGTTIQMNCTLVTVP